MSRAISMLESDAGPAPEEELDEQATGETVLEFLPSWLVSLVFHLVLVLLMALFTVAGNSGLGDAVLLSVTSGGNDGPGDSDLLAASLEMPSELESPQQLEAPAEFAEIPTPVEVPTDISLIDPTGLVAPTELTGLPNGTADSGMGGGTGTGEGRGTGSDKGDFAQTGVFGLVDEGADFVYVFDRSQSMNSTFSYTSEGETVFSITPLIAAKAELVRSLHDLDTQNRFHIIFYNHESWLFDPGRNSHRGLITATPDNRTRAERFIASVYGDGRTRHVPPLETAIRMRPDVIFLLTDGEEKDDPSPAELARLRKLNNGRTKINVVQFCFEMRSEGGLVTLAKENGGRHIFMNVSQLAPGLGGMAQVPPTAVPVP